eukprot:s1786_g2.t2
MCAERILTTQYNAVVTTGRIMPQIKSSAGFPRICKSSLQSVLFQRVIKHGDLLSPLRSREVAWAHPRFGNLLATAGYDMKVIVWKEERGQWMMAYVDTNHQASVNSVEFAPQEQGLRLACASSDGMVSVLTYMPDGQWHRNVLQGHPGGAQTVNWAPVSYRDGVPSSSVRLATGGCDNNVKALGEKNSAPAIAGACADPIARGGNDPGKSSSDLPGRLEMSSGATSQTRTKDGVPIWDGDPGNFTEFVEAARLYEQGTAPHKRAQVAPRIAAELTASAKKFITGQPPDWLSFAGGVERLLDRLRQGLGRPKISEVTEHLSKFFNYSRRKPGESVNDYVARRSEVYLRAQQAMARLGKTGKREGPEPQSGGADWRSYSGGWSRRSSMDSGAGDAEAPPQEEDQSTAAPSTQWSWSYESRWSAEPWWERSSWLLLQDAGLDANERGLVMTTTGEDYSVEAVAHAMRTLFTDGDMKKRDSSRRQHGFWGSVEDEGADEGMEAPMDDMEAQETLDDESFAMWSEAQGDIQEAMAVIGNARRTLREARAKQHAVKMSRQYYKVGGRPGSSGTASGPRPRDDSQLVCLRCQKKGHRAANCPLPPPSANLANEETASFICYAEGPITENEHPISEDFVELTATQAAHLMKKEAMPFIGYMEDSVPEHESALATGITTSEAVAQGKAILDCGATRSIGSVHAIERLMEMNIRAKGNSGVVSVDTTNRPVFSFGNSSMNQCASTVRMGITAGKRHGAVQIHALDHGTGPSC